jgi:PAS domain S-box-containing protein
MTAGAHVSPVPLSVVQFEQVTGYPKDELIKLTFFNLVALDDLQETFSIVARMLNGNGDEKKFRRLAIGKNRGQTMYITVSIVMEGPTPKYFQCSLSE